MHDYIVVLVPSLIAIVIMVILIKATRLEHLVRLDNEAIVQSAIDEHFEGQKIDHIILSKDTQYALAIMQDGTVILVRAFGDRMTVRVLNEKNITSLNGQDEALEIKLNDYTWPRAHLVFENTAARSKVQDMIEKLTQNPAEAVSHA